VVYGTIPESNQGKRSDISALIDLVKDGATDREIFTNGDDSNQSTLFRHFKHAQHLRQALYQPTAQEQIVNVYWGAPGTGKTRKVWDLHAADTVYNATLASEGWFDNINVNHKVLLFDDPDFSKIPLTKLLNWLDRYPIYLPVKGSSFPRMTTHIYITHNHHPRDWYPTASAEQFAALTRRITTITHFENPFA